MNKQLISIYLEEIMFDKQNKKLTEAFGFKKVGHWAGQKAYDGDEADKRVSNIKKADESGNAKLGDKLTAIHNKKAKRQKIATKTAQVGLGAAYAGAAYGLYKGIKALYKKYKASKTPEQKASIKAQITSKKAQLQKVKSKR